MFLTQGKPERGRLTPFRYGTAGTTTTTSLASQGGLLINIDSATGDIPQTGTGWVEDEKYGFYGVEFATSTSIEFKTGIISGHKVLRINLLDATARARVNLIPASNYSTSSINIANSSKLIPLKPSTKYKFKIRARISLSSGSGPSASLDFTQFTSSITGTSAISSIGATTTDFTYIERSFTSAADGAFLGLLLNSGAAGGVGYADYDINSMTLEEVIEPVANSLVTPSPSLVSFTAVGSTDNIDQSQLTNNTSQGLGTVAEQKLAQPFTPTKSKFTGVVLQKAASVGTFVGTITASIVNDTAGSPGTTTYASYAYTSATWNALANSTDFTIPLPCNLTAGTAYWIQLSCSTADNVNYALVRINNLAGGQKAWNGAAWGAAMGRAYYFKTLYYKPTTNFKASQNNLNVSISADEDGFAEGAVTNILTGAYTWGLGVSATDLLTGASVYSATAGAGPIVTTQSIINNYGFYNYAGYNWIGTPATTNTQDLIWKFTTTRPITGDVVITFRTIERTTGTTTMAYSLDNSAYVAMGTIANSANTEIDYSYTITGLVGETDFFIRFRRAGTSSKQDIANLAVSTTVNTASINGVLKNYPTNKDIIKQYSTTLSGATTSATYRATKWGFPAIEYAGIIDQSQLLSSANYSIGVTTVIYLGQQFLPSKSGFTGVVLRKHTGTGAFAGDITVAIVNDNAGVPGSTILATSTISNATWAGLVVGVDYTVSLPCTLTVNGSTKYWIRLFSSTSSATDYARIKAVATSNYADGSVVYGTDGISYSATNGDMYFKTLYDEVQYLDVDTTATGSTVAFSELGTSYTTVADGASLAISSTSTPNIFVKANITANRLYSSSNDYVANSDKDGSLRQTLTYQVIQ